MYIKDYGLHYSIELNIDNRHKKIFGSSNKKDFFVHLNSIGSHSSSRYVISVSRNGKEFFTGLLYFFTEERITLECVFHVSSPMGDFLPNKQLQWNYLKVPDAIRTIKYLLNEYFEVERKWLSLEIN